MHSRISMQIKKSLFLCTCFQCRNKRQLHGPIRSVLPLASAISLWYYWWSEVILLIKRSDTERSDTKRSDTDKAWFWHVEIVGKSEIRERALERRMSSSFPGYALRDRCAELWWAFWKLILRVILRIIWLGIVHALHCLNPACIRSDEYSCRHHAFAYLSVYDLVSHGLGSPQPGYGSQVVSKYPS